MAFENIKKYDDYFVQVAREGDLKQLQKCLDYGVDINQNGKDNDTALHAATASGHLQIVRTLLEKQNIDPNKANAHGYSPLHTAAEGGQHGIVQLLLKRIDIVHRMNKYGDTPLNLALKGGHLDIVQLLVSRPDIDPNECDSFGNSILHTVVIKEQLELVKLLLEGKYIDPNKSNQLNGCTALHLAASQEHIPITQFLLERKDIDPNKVKKNGATALYSAVLDGHLEIVRLLLERRDIDPNKVGKNGEPLLHIAARKGDIKMVKLLLKRTNLDPTEKNQENKTPHDVVDEYRYDQFADNAVEKNLIKDALKLFMTMDRSAAKDILTAMSHDEETYESDGVNPASIPFAGTSREFYKLLSTGTYESFENRVFLCGSCACGKSTLASVLIGSPIPLEWKSTDGLVIHFGRNGINLETYEMVPLKEGTNKSHDVYTKVVIGQPNLEKGTFRTAQHDYHVGSSSTTIDNLTPNTQGVTKDSSCSVPDSLVTNTRKSEMETTTPMIFPQVKQIRAYAVQDDIMKEVANGQYKIKISPSDLVDFGGQRSYDMTHQLFVQHGGTFVVMFDGSRDFQKPLAEYTTGDISNESIVKHWVHSILTYCVDDDDVMPMILFAATHSDEFPEDMEKKKAEFVKRVAQMFGTHERKKHIVFDPVFFINGTDKDDQEIEKLKKQLVAIARSQPSWGERRPMIWVPLELMITNMKKDNIYIIPKSHLAEANKMNGNLSLSTKQLEDFLLTQHALGKIMYFEQPEINKFIILYPPVLVNILKSFITDKMFWPENEILRNILGRMSDTGKIYKRDLLKLWQQKQVQDCIPTDEFKEFVIQILIHLDVLVLPKRYSDKSDTQLSNVDYFLVPCIVNTIMPMSFLDNKSFADRTTTLVYRLNNSSIPSALAFKLIGAVSGVWPIKEMKDIPLLYHSSAVLCVDSNTEFRIMVEDKRVVVYLTHSSSRSYISPDVAASIQECLTLTLRVVLKFFLSSIGKNLTNIDVTDLFQVEIGVVCHKSPCVLSISKAQQTSNWVCDSGRNHYTRIPLLWFFEKAQKECPLDCPGVDKEGSIMSPSDKHLARLANQLSVKQCKKLVHHLGLKDMYFEDIEYQYQQHPLSVKIMALNCWKRKKIQGKSSTKSFDDLQIALTEIGAERHVLCQVFREDTDFFDSADVRLQEIPDDDVLNGLTHTLGDCAIQLGIELEITTSSIEETLKRHHKDMYSQIADILRKWKTSTDSEHAKVKPTIYRLMLVLERLQSGGIDYLKTNYLGQ